MATAAPETPLEIRIRKNEEHFAAVYKEAVKANKGVATLGRKLDEFRGETRQNFVEMNARFVEMNARFDEQDGKVDELDGKVNLIIRHFGIEPV